MTSPDNTLGTNNYSGDFQQVYSQTAVHSANVGVNIIYDTTSQYLGDCWMLDIVEKTGNIFCILCLLRILVDIRGLVYSTVSC